jgi:hypothetical protein
MKSSTLRDGSRLSAVGCGLLWTANKEPTAEMAVRPKAPMVHEGGQMAFARCHLPTSSRNYSSMLNDDDDHDAKRTNEKFSIACQAPVKDRPMAPATVSHRAR